ncbi:glutathione S-transferase [Pseudomonas sp. SJZ079]|uniref:glutathione S-transferase family protein n=1 Tax=Pseudomonas sp. SJZ079 TaxID=2572887 RepID=UPI001198ECE9|nr:glutathione S-transferase family protein [Pseudomonas sp. SJZ079]TWC33258.1 glutathione S-transferase [Pseudomonas sp. SJZ079]
MSSASMTLFHSPMSPFARKVRVLLHETGQLDRVALKEVQLTPVNPSAELNAQNPAGKIPALRLADGNVLFDSRVILDYLDQQHVGEPLIPASDSPRWRRLTLAALADAILDAAVSMRYESALRPEDKRWPEWQHAQREKIERSLQQFEEQAIAELSCHFDIAAIGLACALGYLDLRQADLGWRQRYPQLAGWYAEVSQRPSMLSTQPPG